MNEIIISALCEKLRHWRYLCDKNVVLAGEFWNDRIMGHNLFIAFWFIAAGDIPYKQFERDYRELVESMLETELNVFNRSFFASQYRIED